MISSLRFSDTRLQLEPHRLRLLGPANEVLLALVGHEIDEAVHAGFLDRQNFHFSMFEYAKLRTLAPVSPATERSCESFDQKFLADLHIRWD